MMRPVPWALNRLPMPAGPETETFEACRLAESVANPTAAMQLTPIVHNMPKKFAHFRAARLSFIQKKLLLTMQ